MADDLIRKIKEDDANPDALYLAIDQVGCLVRQSVERRPFPLPPPWRLRGLTSPAWDHLFPGLVHRGCRARVELEGSTRPPQGRQIWRVPGLHRRLYSIRQLCGHVPDFAGAAPSARLPHCNAAHVQAVQAADDRSYY